MPCSKIRTVPSQNCINCSKGEAVKHRLSAHTDLVSRYVGVFRAAWRRRGEMDTVRRTADELAFQPAVIELVDTPASPLPRRAMQAIVVIFATALLWACIGRLDIVAVAKGKVVSSAHTKTIQGLETSIVRRIAVSDGQIVRRGDLLLELDAVGVHSDRSKAQDALTAARLNAARSAALAVAYQSNRPPVIESLTGVTSRQMQEAGRLAESEFEVFKKKTDGLSAQLAQKQAEQSTIRQSIAPAREYARIAADRVSDYKRLLSKNYVSRQEYLTREQERISAERDLAAQENRLKELDEAIKVAKEDLASAVSSARSQALDQERQSREQAIEIEGDLARAHDRDLSMRLVAPIEGTVQQLSVHTVGGVVTPAAPLLSVVPLDVAPEVEATVLNQDIGFVREGQPVVAKLDTFPFTRYGFITGRVLSVSQDAVSDEKLGLIFPIRVALDRSQMRVNGREVRLTSGMAVSVEISTGQRSVISYFLDPLATEVSEAFRER